MPRGSGHVELNDFTRGRIIGFIEGGSSQRIVTKKVVMCSENSIQYLAKMDLVKLFNALVLLALPILVMTDEFVW